MLRIVRAYRVNYFGSSSSQITRIEVSCRRRAYTSRHLRGLSAERAKLRKHEKCQFKRRVSATRKRRSKPSTGHASASSKAAPLAPSHWLFRLFLKLLLCKLPRINSHMYASCFFGLCVHASLSRVCAASCRVYKGFAHAHNEHRSFPPSFEP
jgi:hypothetical protein